MPYRQVAETALADWRAAELELADHADGSPGWLEASARAVEAKERYQQAIQDARVAHTPEPRPFEEAVSQQTAQR